MQPRHGAPLRVVGEAGEAFGFVPVQEMGGERICYQPCRPTLRDGRVFGYQSQLTLPGGKRRSFSGEMTRDVQQKLHEARSGLLHGWLTASRQTVKVYLDGWLETVRHSIKPRTYEVYTLNVRRIGAHIGHVRLDALAPAHVQNC